MPSPFQVPIAMVAGGSTGPAAADEDSYATFDDFLFHAAGCFAVFFAADCLAASTYPVALKCSDARTIRKSSRVWGSFTIGAVLQIAGFAACP